MAGSVDQMDVFAHGPWLWTTICFVYAYVHGQEQLVLATCVQTTIAFVHVRRQSNNVQELLSLVLRSRADSLINSYSHNTWATNTILAYGKDYFQYLWILEWKHLTQF